jgi:hypothetical protein
MAAGVVRGGEGEEIRPEELGGGCDELNIERGRQAIFANVSFKLGAVVHGGRSSIFLRLPSGAVQQSS